MYNTIIENRNNRFPINSKNHQEMNAETLKNWITAVESLRIAASAVAAKEYGLQEVTKDEKDAVFVAWLKIRYFFKNRSINLRMPGEAADYDTIIALVSEMRKPGKDKNRAFLPTGKLKFRKNIEVFCADRAKKVLADSAAKIEEAKRAAREEKRSEGKAPEGKNK